MLKFIHKNEYNPNLQRDLFGEYNQHGVPRNVYGEKTFEETLRIANAVDSIRVLINRRLEQNLLNSTDRGFIESRIFGSFVNSEPLRAVDIFDDTVALLKAIEQHSEGHVVTVKNWDEQMVVKGVTLIPGDPFYRANQGERTALMKGIPVRFCRSSY